MKNRSEEIKEILDDIFARMDANKKEILFFQKIKDENLKGRVKSLTSLRLNVSEAIQSGDLRHALILLLIMKDTLQKLDEIKEELNKDISEEILK